MKSEPDLTLPGLAHDLNNVFQTLVDAADRLHDDPRWAEVSSAILRSVERGQRITRTMFRDGMNDGGSARLSAVVTSARAFVQDSQGRNANIRFECDIDPTLELRQGWVWERAMINFFLNSCRAMPEGGKIYVCAQHDAHGVAITVADEGCGIAEELLPRVFEPHISGYGSSGLGLHIVKTIVDQDHGSIHAANTSLGAEFRIWLPESALAVSARIRKASA